MKPAGFERERTGREETRQSILDPAFNRLRLRLPIRAKEKPRQFAQRGESSLVGTAGEKERLRRRLHPAPNASRSQALITYSPEIHRMETSSVIYELLAIRWLAKLESVI